MNNHKTSQEQTNDPMAANFRSRNCVRLLNIIIQRTQPVSDVFVYVLPAALREYADAIETEECGSL